MNFGIGYVRVVAATARRGVLATVVAAAVFCFVAVPADAAMVTIGQLAPANPVAGCYQGPQDAVQQYVGSGASYTVPGGYNKITSWSTSAGAGAGQMLELKVWRLVDNETWRAVAHDGPRALNPSTVNTFSVSLSVQAGDVLGLNTTNNVNFPNACTFTGGLGDFAAFSMGFSDAPDGGTAELNGGNGHYRLNIAATLTGSGIAPKPKCEVPTVTHLTLKLAKRLLRLHSCTLGKVKPKHHSKSARIKSQHPKPGTVLAPGGKVNVTV
jgi:hypothetical protein